MDLAQTRGKIWREMRRKEWEFFRFERLNKHQEEALRLVVESKSDIFVWFWKVCSISGFVRSPGFVYCVFLCETNKLERKKQDALAGYSM